MIIPCIEIASGRVLGTPLDSKGGLEEILAQAEPLSRCSELLLVDGDASSLSGDNLKTLSAISSRLPCIVAGGIRNAERGRLLLRAGAEKIVLDAGASPDLHAAFRAEHLIIAVDAGDQVTPPDVVMASFRGRCAGFLLENLPYDPARQLPDLEVLRRFTLLTDTRLLVAVGDVGAQDVSDMDHIGVDAIVGEGVLTGRISVPEAFVSCMHFGPDESMPTVVVDPLGQVLMVTSSSPRSLEVALRSGEGTYFDPERGGLWRKGERSGNDQLVLRCRAAHDRRSLLFTVRQAGNACEASYSWFGDRAFNLEFLSRIAASKRNQDPAVSYTARLLTDPGTIEARLREKVSAVCSTDRRDETLWAVADLVYFLVVKAVSCNMSWSDVIRELRGRQR